MNHKDEIVSLALEAFKLAARIADIAEEIQLKTSGADEPGEPQGQPQEESVPQATEPQPPTKESVRAALAEIARSGKAAQVRELLEHFGAEKLSDIDPAFYSDLLTEAGKIK